MPGQRPSPRPRKPSRRGREWTDERELLDLDCGRHALLELALDGCRAGKDARISCPPSPAAGPLQARLDSLLRAASLAPPSGLGLGLAPAAACLPAPLPRTAAPAPVELGICRPR